MAEYREGRPDGEFRRTSERPYGVWWYVALALVAAAIVESIFAGRYMSPEQAEPLARKRAA